MTESPERTAVETYEHVQTAIEKNDNIRIPEKEQQQDVKTR